MPFPPSPKWFEDSFFGLFVLAAALRFVGLAAFVLFCGCVSLWRRDRENALLLLSPVVPLLAASGLHKYPFGGRRLTLFFVPVLLLLMADGAETVRALVGNYIAAILLVLLLIHPGLYTLHKFVSPLAASDRTGVMPLEEMRPVLDQLKSRLQSGDPVYVYHLAKPAFEYYAERTGFPPENVTIGTIWGDDAKKYEREVGQFGGKRLWIVFSHIQGAAASEVESLKFCANLRGRRLENLVAPGTEADLYNVTRGE